MRTSCVFCGQQVDSEKYGTYQRVCGWEEHRKQGGTNALRLRETSYEWACADCIDQRVKGMHIQPNLF